MFFSGVDPCCPPQDVVTVKIMAAIGAQTTRARARARDPEPRGQGPPIFFFPGGPAGLSVRGAMDTI